MHIVVIPAKAGISESEATVLLAEIPAFAGVTMWGHRHA